MSLQTRIDKLKRRIPAHAHAGVMTAEQVTIRIDALRSKAERDPDARRRLRAVGEVLAKGASRLASTEREGVKP